MLRTPKVSLRTLEKDLDSWIREREMPEKSPQWCHAQVLQDHFFTLLVTVAVGWSSSGVQYLNLITYSSSGIWFPSLLQVLLVKFCLCPGTRRCVSELASCI